MSEREPIEAAAADDALRSSTTLEAIGRLTGAMAHEFRNLLLVIGGLTDLILNRTDLERSARRDLEQIRRATEQADELTQHLVAIGRKPSDGPQPLTPSALVRPLEHLLAGLLGEKIVLRVELAESIGSVCVDPIEFEQALLDLVLKAREALPHGGDIRIATGRVEIAAGTPGTLRPGRYVALRVSDDGTGGPVEEGAQPCDLTALRGFVARAGGEVHVRSGLGAGTTVELLLPEIEPSRPAAET
jgi:signal transduction histidine kinase